MTWRRASTLALVGALASACAKATCDNSCETNLWPTMIVGILGEAPDLTCKIQVVTGTFEADRSGCPTELDRTRFHCTCSFNTAPRDKSARVSITTASGGDVVSDLVVPLR